MSFKVEIWGDYALFTRPEFKTERVSYDVITPSAARGILEAVYWHPGLEWVIDRITVCNPIRFEIIKRNEIKNKINCNNVLEAMNGKAKPLYISRKDAAQQRTSRILRDVRYVIEAHFRMTKNAAPSDSEAKFAAIMERRLDKGQNYHQPYMGCSGFPAYYRRLKADENCKVADELMGEKDLGYMLYDLDYSDKENVQPMFYRAKMIDGVINVPDKLSEEVRK